MNGPAAIDLLRHGDTGHSGFRGLLDDALTASGWQQMEQAVTGQRWDVVVSSPRRRCRDFADHYAARTGSPHICDERLAEMHFGDWEGKTAAQIMEHDAEALQRFWQGPRQYSPPGGEEFSAFSARVLEVWQELNLRFVGQRVLVVTHAGVIRRLLCHVRDLPLAQMLTLEVLHGSLHPTIAAVPAA